VVAWLTLWCSAPVAAQAIDQLYTLAKQEKTLVMWAADPTVDYDSSTRAFEQQFPGVSVLLTRGFSNALDAGIEEQVRAKNGDTDLVIFQTVQHFLAWNRHGLLLPFKPDGTEQVRHKDVPRLAIDFLRAEFKGKLIGGFPAHDVATLFAFATIVQKYGWGYMDQYMKQQPKFVQGHLGVARSLGSGEGLVSVGATVSSTLAVQRAGGKVAVAAPTDDVLPVFFTAEAILKDAPHPNAAKLYVTWFLSKEWQSRAGVYSSRSDVPPPVGLPALSSYRLEDRYLEFVSSEDHLTDLRKRFENYVGPLAAVSR
jgi:ABC-type Fe3+ transport system substrate-binding protein